MVITLNKKIENIGLANPIVLYEEYNGRLSEDSIIQGHCLADHLALNDLEFYPLTTMRILLTSNDKLKEWEEVKRYITSRFIDKIMEQINDNFYAKRFISETGKYTALFIIDCYEYFLIHPNVGDPYKQVADLIFPKFTDEKTLVRWIKLRINFLTKVRKRLIDSILNFYPAYGASVEKARMVVSDMNNENYNLLRWFFEDSKKFFMKNGGTSYNASTVGLGSIIFSQPIVEDAVNLPHLKGWQQGTLDFITNDIAFYYITKYDATIISHGNKIKSNWQIQPIRSLEGTKTYTDVNELLHQLYIQGCKKIHLVSCNHYGLDLAPEFYKSNDMLIVMYKGKVLIG